MAGKFIGVGVGPGAADLLTMRAVNTLKNADVVCIPRSGKDNAVIALQTAGEYISPTVEILEINTPMTRDKSVLEREWQKGAAEIVKHLNAGKTVAFITIGDSTLFSTYTYLLAKVRTLAPQAQYESVPGVTSFAAASAALNMALAEGNEKLAIIPAVDDPAELDDILLRFPNAVLMKVAGKYDEIVTVLERNACLDKAVFVSRVGFEEQFITRNLPSLCGKKQDYLSMIIVKQGGI